MDNGVYCNKSLDLSCPHLFIPDVNHENKSASPKISNLQRLFDDPCLIFHIPSSYQRLYPNHRKNQKVQNTIGVITVYFMVI